MTQQVARESLASTEQASSKTRQFVGDAVETVLLALVVFYGLRVAIRNFRIEGSSMEPNLRPGQYILISRWDYWVHPPQRGDIIVFKAPNARGRDLVKRVVALPGERLEIRDDQVFVNGQPLIEPYASLTQYGGGRWTLAEDEVFVLGDNRSHSQDSRRWGPLKIDRIIGKGWICYWPPVFWGPVRHDSS